jgi:hypothetical protein
MNWSAADYLIFALMVLALVGGLILMRRMSGDIAYRLGALTALLAGFVMVWANGAVGLIGAEGSDLNLLFFAFPGLGLLGAALSRLRPAGLARTCTLLLIAQLTVGAGLFLTGLISQEDVPVRDVALTTLVFATAWGLAAALFQRAARRSPS